MCDVKQTSSFKNLTKQLSLTAGKLALVATLALGVATGIAPSPAYAGGGEFFGTIGGGLAGGLIGNAFGHGRGRTAATAGGAVLGAVLGNSYGHGIDNRRDYDRGDRYYSGYSSNTVYYSEPAPQRVYYVPSYERRVRTVEVVPAPVTYVQDSYVVDNSYGSRNNGSYCREYNQGVTVGGRTQASYGTACMQPDGSWKIQ